ncbi:MAG: FHA domain-containing protein [Actinomycetota bacterium]
MSEQLIDLLKLGLLALLYLFFLRVIWAVWTELRAPAVESVGADAEAPPRRRERPAKPRRSSKAELTVLRVLEPAELVGTHALASEMTMGRAPGCTIVVDDTYVSQLHARVFKGEDGWYVEDIGSTNGTFLNGDQLTSSRRVRRGDRIQLGNAVMEVS